MKDINYSLILLLMNLLWFWGFGMRFDIFWSFIWITQLQEAIYLSVCLSDYLSVCLSISRDAKTIFFAQNAELTTNHYFVFKW